MSAPRILIVYGSSYGQTAKIAGRIGARLQEEGCAVRLVRGDSEGVPAELDRFDAVVIGASLIIGGYQRYIRRFVREHADALNDVPSAFFAVCGSEGGQDERAKADARRIQREFLERNGWRPALTASFGGAIAYTRYNPLVRWIMKRIARKAGGSTDTTRDHEYTDWGRVDAFAARIAHLATGPTEAESSLGRRWSMA